MNPAPKIKPTGVLAGRTGFQDDFKKLLHSNIVIVDDEPTTLEMVQAYLEEVGYHNFILIEDSTQAMDALEQERPDVLLLDLIMPEVSGFDILQAVRKHPHLKRLPVIVLTASTDPKDKLLALGLGATDFLAKPVDPSELGLRMWNTLAAKAYVDELAYYDPLTKLPNRRMFMDHIEWALKWAKRDQTHLALMSIELDQFDKISAMSGVLTGDEVLQQVAQRILGVIRDTDLLGRFEIEKDTDVNLFRFDRGVFSLVIHRLKSERSAAPLAKRIVESLREPLVVEDEEIYLTASIGIAAYPAENVDDVGLLRLASSARNQAKTKGGDSFGFSSREISRQYETRLKLEVELRKALERNELVLHYQPRVDIKTGAITSVEALLRWHREDNRLISPDEFIPVAEETGLIIPIGEWVLKKACEQLSEWCQSDIDPIGMTVNVSMIQFSDVQLPVIVERIVRESRIDSHLLTLEFTESALMEDAEKVIETMRRLKEIGVKLAMDDFGTGFSSFKYLRDLPLDELKIDQSFLANLYGDANTRAVVSSIIYLSRSLGLLTVAEGVETKEQLFFLESEHCDLYQGFLFSPALPGPDMSKLLECPVLPY